MGTQQGLRSNADKYEEEALLAQACISLIESYSNPTLDERRKDEINYMLGTHAFGGIYRRFDGGLIAVTGGDWHSSIRSLYIVNYMEIGTNEVGAEKSMPIVGYDGFRHAVRVDGYIGPRFAAVEFGEGITLNRLIKRACAGEF